MTDKKKYELAYLKAFKNVTVIKKDGQFTLMNRDKFFKCTTPIRTVTKEEAKYFEGLHWS